MRGRVENMVLGIEPERLLYETSSTSNSVSAAIVSLGSVP